jgi:hypothetical protein
MWIAESVLLICCPHAPDALVAFISRSDSFISISKSSTSGKTATVMAEV